ncbi:MAG: porin family protein [Sinobacteraceae bacterium]|nr:porin family protein [Nevskiaceae bacterium]
MMKARTISLLAAASAAGWMTFPAQAMADDTGFYVGANVGRVLSTFRRTDINDALTNGFSTTVSGFTLGPTSVQKSHVMWTADVGYMLSRNFGVEASYLHLGSLRYSAFGTDTASSGTGTALVTTRLDVKTQGPALAGVGVLPMTNFWQIDARLGACEAKATSTYLTTLDTGPFPGKVSKTSTALLLGVGTGVTVSSHWMVRFDYMRLEHITEESLNRSFNIDLITVGAAFVF